MGMVLCLLGGGNFASAETETDWAVQAEMCDRALLKNPRDNDTWAGLVEARLNLEDTKRAGEALAIWRKNVRDAEKKFPAMELLQGDLAYSKDDLKGAQEAWAKYVGLAPGKVAGWDRLAWAQERLGNLPGAIESITAGLKAGKDAKKQASRYAWRARLKIALRDWDGAAADLGEGNKRDATNAEVQKLYPKFERSGQWLPELKRLNKVIAETPEGPSKAAALLDRSEWLTHEGFKELAFEDASQAFKIAPKSLRAEIWKGLLAWDLGRGDEIGQVAKIPLNKLRDEDAWGGFYILRKTLQELDNANPESRAEALFKLHEFPLAWREIKDVDGARIKWRLLKELGDLPAAGRAATRAAEIHPQDPGVWTDLADWEFLNGNAKEALADLDRAKQLDPKLSLEERKQEISSTLGE
jgi:tetratricopeptide (TPR) repeat protein